MKRFILIAGLVIVLALATTRIAAAQGQGDGGAGDASTVLAPLLAAALGIERSLEALWGIVEVILARFPKYAFLKKREAELTEEDKTNQANHSQFKTWSSALIGIVIGIIVALAAQLAMFNMIGLESVVDWADMVITGVVIGSGSKFTHDAIGILNQAKRLVANWAELIDVRKSAESSQAEGG